MRSRSEFEKRTMTVARLLLTCGLCRKSSQIDAIRGKPHPAFTTIDDPGILSAFMVAGLRFSC